MRPKFQNRPVQLARQGSHLLASLPWPLPSTAYFYKIAMLSHFRVCSKKLHSTPHHGHEQEYGVLHITWVQPGGFSQEFTSILNIQKDQQNIVHQVLSDSSLRLAPILVHSSGCLSQSTEAVSPTPVTQSHSWPGTAGPPSSWHDAGAPLFYKCD